MSALDGGAAVRLLHRGMLRVTDVTDVTAPSRHARRADLSVGRRTPRLSGGLTTGMPRQVCLRPCRSFHSAARACTTLRQPAQAGPDGGAKVTTTPHWQARMCLLLCQTGKKRVFFILLCFVLVVVFCVPRTAPPLIYLDATAPIRIDYAAIKRGRQGAVGAGLATYRSRPSTASSSGR